MNKLSEILKQPESRKLEFKEIIPSKANLAKTIIGFANDAGGEFYLGIKNKPREITGLNEDVLIELEEKISNIAHDNCKPIILPEITFLIYKGKHIIKTQIYKGSNPPYYLKNKSVEEGTYIRVGSSNRQASPEIIAELERQKLSKSFDSELSYSKPADQSDIKDFTEIFFEKTQEKLTLQILKKLELFQFRQDVNLPTNALILLSDDELRKQMFPYAKIECARFKGTIPGNFIDQKPFCSSIALQPEQAYQFVLRHIAEGSMDYTGVYRNDRWEYPIIAIREVIRNAVIHRDYSLSGMDIKIAIFDDKIEITNPGRLPPAVDYNDMQAGQSSIRNKLLAPVFKRIGIIEQWGNGLRLIANELQKYPEISLEWKEPGMAFRVTFVKKNYRKQQELPKELPKELQQELQQESLYSKILYLVQKKTSATKELSESLGQKSISGQLYSVVNKLKEDGLIEWTIPEKAKSSKQKYQITQKGIVFINLLKKNK